MANVKKRTTAEIARDLLDARRSGDNAAQNMAAAELAQNTAERREKAKSYQESKKADAIQKALEDARKREEREKAAAAFRSSIGNKQTDFGIRGKNSYESRFPVLTQRQLDTAAVSHTAKEAKKATKAYDDYMKSDERKAGVDEATNEILKKVFGNLGQGNADLQLQSAPRQILESKKQDKEKELEARKDYAVNQENAAKNAQVTHKNMDDLSNWSEEDRQALQLYATNRNRDLNAPIELTSSPWYQTAEQEASGLIAKYGKQRVDALAESFLRSENQTAAENVMAAAQKGADGFWGGVGHSAASVAAKLIGGTTGPLGYLQEAATGTGQYSTLDPNNAGQLPDIYASAVREQVGENIEHSDAMRRFGEALTGAAAYTQTGQLPAMKVHQPEREGESSTAGKVGAALYKAGMGAADTVARGVMGGGSKTLSLGLAAGQSFGNTVSQASKQGASPGQAMALGAVNAGIEAATEYIPLDELLKTAKTGSTGVKAVLANVLKQAGIEATTEEISLMGTTLAEAAILREKSGYNQQIQNAVANGASYQQAKLEADRALLAEAGETAIQSALSGAMSTAGAEVSARMPTVKEKLDAAIQEALGVKKNTAINKKSGSIATSGPEQADPNTPVATGGTAPNSGNVTQAPAEGQMTNHETNARSALASPSPINNISEATGIVNENSFESRPQGVDTEKQSAEGGQREKGVIPEKTSYDEYILRNEDGTPFEAMGAASLGNSGKLEYDSLLYDGNIQRTRKGDVREIEVPIEDADGRNVSEFVGNSMNSAATADVFTDTIKRIVAEGKVSHDVQTNEESLRKAAEELKNEGDTYKSVQNIKAVAESGKCSTEDIAKAVLLYENLMDQIDQKAQNGENAEQLLQSMAEDTYVSLAQMATNSGRNLQLFSLFRKMTPESQAKILENEVMREIKKLQKQGTVKKGYQAQVDPNLLEDYKKAAEENRRAKDPEAKQAAEQKMKDIQNAIYKAEAAKAPASFKAKWDAWRYMAMLGNVKTNVRNVGGNFAFKPYVEIKELMATGMEKLFIRDKSKRTRAQMHRVFSQDDRELYRWAKADAKSEGMKNVLKGSAKLGDDMSKSNLADDMHIFNNKVFETVRKSVNGAVEAGDMLFKNPYYADALASYVKAKGYSVADIEAGHVSEEVLNEGRKFAVDEAMKNTFNDCNALSDFFANTLRYKGDNPVGKVANTMAEGILPFRRTPANVIVRFAEYSPVGVAKGIGSTINHLRGGEISAATAIDQLASGLTGTAMAGLGYALANGFLGLKLRGSNVDEDEERQGHQEYALEFSIGGKEYSYKIDWAAPGNLPLFLGANIYEWVNGQGGDTSVSKFTSFVYGFLTMFEPMLELSCLSSLNDIIEAGKYSDGNALYAVAAQAAFSYFTQGIPSLIRQTTQAFPENKQQTFANSSDPLIRDMQRRAANIPIVGAAFKMDKVDEWGETESQGKWYERAFHAYFNPGTLKAIDNSNLEQEISRLNQAQPDSVTPPETAKTITFTDSNGNRHTNRRLTEEEYSKLATVQGQTAKQILEQLIDSKSYRSLTDDQKAEAFGYVYDYAREKGRTEAIEGYEGLKGWMADIEKGKESKAILDKILGGSLSDAFDSLTKGWREGTEADVSGDLESAYETYKGMTAAEKAAFKKENSGRIANYLEAREHGIKTDTYLDLYESYYNLDQRKDIDTTEKAHQWAETVQKAREAGKINDGQKDHLRSNLDFRYSMEAKTEKFDEMVESGLSSKKAFDVGSLLRGIEPAEGKEDVTNSQKWEAIADMDFLSEAEKDSVMKVHMPDYDPADESPNTTELKYDYIRQELGYSAEEFVDIYMAYLENNKKDDRIDAWMNLGYSRAEADVLYRLYGASGKKKINVEEWYNAQK